MFFRHEMTIADEFKTKVLMGEADIKYVREGERGEDDIPGPASGWVVIDAIRVSVKNGITKLEFLDKDHSPIQFVEANLESCDLIVEGIRRFMTEIVFE
jgi:hypothetical protein